VTLHGQDWDFKYTRGVWGNIESCRIEVKKMSCSCHKLVCEEHIKHLRPFEEISVGVFKGICEVCGKTITGQDEYAWLPTELFNEHFVTKTPEDQ